MVMLTIVTTDNPCTVFLDQPIPQARQVGLLSCSLWNSWHNLEKSVQIIVIDSRNAIGLFIPAGHYTTQSLASAFNAI